MENLTEPTTSENLFPTLNKQDEGPGQEAIDIFVQNTEQIYNLILQLNQQETLSQEDQNTLSKSKQHIEIMLQKTWFITNITSTQLNNLQQIVES